MTITVKKSQKLALWRKGSKGHKNMYVASKAETLKALKIYSWSLCRPLEFQTSLRGSNRNITHTIPTELCFQELYVWQDDKSWNINGTLHIRKQRTAVLLFLKGKKNVSFWIQKNISNFSKYSCLVKRPSACFELHNVNNRFLNLTMSKNAPF